MSTREAKGWKSRGIEDRPRHTGEMGEFAGPPPSNSPGAKDLKRTRVRLPPVVKDALASLMLLSRRPRGIERARRRMENSWQRRTEQNRLG